MNMFELTGLNRQKAGVGSVPYGKAVAAGCGIRRAFQRLCAAVSAACALGAAEMVRADVPDAYIESDGTSYIDTGYTPSTNTSVYVDFEWRDTTSQQFIFESGDSVSATNSSYRTYFRPYISSSGFNAWAMNRQLWQNTGVKAEVGQRCQLFLDGYGLNVTFTTPSETKSVPQPSWSHSKQACATTFKLFASSSGKYNKAKARIYQFKIYEAGELVRNFVPAKRDGYVGFHDDISGEFICNKSGFTSGGVEELPEINDPYIESDGTAGINTGVQAQPGLKIEVDYQIAKPLGEIVPQWRIVATDAKDDRPRVSAYVNSDTNVALTSGNTWAGVTSTGILADNRRHTVILGDTGNKCHYLLGRTVLATISGNAITSRSLVQIGLLATPKENYGATFSNKAKARLYGAKFWVNGKLIRDFRPRTVNGVAGLEDVAQGGFYTSSGYTASAGVTEGLTSSPAYVESDGSCYSFVNTYFFATTNTKVEVDYQLVRLDAGKILWGTYGENVGMTCLHYYDNSGWFCPQAKDGNYSAPTMSPAVYMDSGRHTSLIDIPARRLALLDPNGNVESEGQIAAPTKNSAWPILLFSGSQNAYGLQRDGQMAKARIFGAKIWEKEGEEYVLKHDFKPCVKGDIVGFKDAVTGRFHSGDKLTAAGPYESETDDAYYIENTTAANHVSIDTGYTPRNETKIVLDYMPLMQQKTQQFPFEAGDSVSATNAEKKAFWRIYGNGSEGKGKYAFSVGDLFFQSTEVPFAPHVRRTITLDSNNLKMTIQTAGYTDRSMAFTDGAYTTNPSKTTLKLLSNSSANANWASGRIYSLKIYQSGTLKCDLVPVSQAGAGAFHDRVTGKIISAKSISGHTAPTASDNLSSPDGWIGAEQREGDAYIATDGTQVLNTGYRATPQTRFEADFQFTSIRGQNRVFGCVVANAIAEMYVQGEQTGSGNVAFLAGDTQTTQVTGKGADLNRHRGVLDLYSHTVGYTGWGYKAAPSAFSMLNSTGPVALFTKNTMDNGFSGWETKHVAKMKLYAFRIYEAGVLKHQYLPYKNGDTVGLYDTVTGDVLTKLAAGTAAANEFAYGGEGYGGYCGAPAALVVRPQDVTVGCNGTKTLKAYVPGAIGYVWTCNGAAVGGATGSELTVGWRKKKDGSRTDVYTASPVFLIDGKEVVGEASEANVTFAVPGFGILLR